MCTLGLLGQSAAAFADDDVFDPDEFAVIDELRSFGRRDPEDTEPEFVDTADFLTRFAGFASLVGEKLRDSEWEVISSVVPTATERAVRQLPPHALRLLGLAKVLRDSAKIPPEQVEPRLNAVFEALGMGMIA